MSTNESLVRHVKSVGKLTAIAAPSTFFMYTALRHPGPKMFRYAIYLRRVTCSEVCDRKALATVTMTTGACVLGWLFYQVFLGSLCFSSTERDSTGRRNEIVVAAATGTTIVPVEKLATAFAESLIDLLPLGSLSNKSC
jgi:hypothetical protein